MLACLPRRWGLRDHLTLTHDFIDGKSDIPRGKAQLVVLWSRDSNPGHFASSPITLELSYMVKCGPLEERNASLKTYLIT